MIISHQPEKNDENLQNDDVVMEILENNLRPQTLSEYFFRGEVKKNLFNALNIFLKAAQQRKEALDHILFYGPPGLGKTTLANILANEMSSQIKVSAGPAIERTGDLAAILTSLEEGDILFIDEIHRLNKNIEEILYSAMEDFFLDIVLGKGPSAQTVRLDLPHFTLVGATTRLSLVGAPLRNRFGVIHRLEFYEVDDLTRIIQRSGKILEMDLSFPASQAIAQRSRGTPRIANHLIKRVRDYCQIKKENEITPKLVQEALRLLEVDQMGLTHNDKLYLEALIKKFRGGPVGLTTLSASIAEDPHTVEETIEPFLIQIGFIKKTSQGREATPTARKHLEISSQENRLL